MKLTNPFASVRNFIRAHESGDAYTPYVAAPMFKDSAPRHAPNQVDTHCLFVPAQDRSLLLRPLSDTHLIEVYHEAKAMQLSEEFISLIEHAIEQRGISLINEHHSLN